MLLQIEKIKINKRIRIDIGDLDALKESLEKFGQFHPITVNSELVLISGFRRLESAKQLGWEVIETKIIESPTKEELLQRELEENLTRKDFTDIELDSAYKRLHKLQKPNLLLRLFRRIKSFFSSFKKVVFCGGVNNT